MDHQADSVLLQAHELLSTRRVNFVTLCMRQGNHLGDVPVESSKFLEVVNETEPRISRFITWHTFGRFLEGNTAILIVQNLSMQIAS